MKPPRRVLTIAGSDSGGGAGIQADLKTLAAHGVYGLTAVTAVTAQNSLAVRAVAPVAPAMVGAQIDAVLEDFGADAVKIGMLWSAETVRVVAARLRAHGAVPIVLDPVMAAGSGAELVAEEAAAVDAIAALLEELLPIATLITPNLPELAILAARLQDSERGAATAWQPAATAALTGTAAGGAAAVPLPATLPARLELARRLAARGPAVLAKGGHDPGPDDATVVDLLLIGGTGREDDPSGVGSVDGGGGSGAGGGRAGATVRRGERLVRFAGPRLRTRATHGTGCTLSAAIAARLAAGEELAAAVGGAIAYVRRAMAAAPRLGAGAGPLAHFHAL